MRSICYIYGRSKNDIKRRKEMKTKILEFLIWDVAHSIVKLCEIITRKGINERFLLMVWLKLGGICKWK